MSHLAEHDQDALGRRRRPFAVVLTLVVLVALLGGIAYGGKRIYDKYAGGPADYSGTGIGSVVVTVKTGDTSGAIGRTLADKDVVKSAEAFTKAAVKDDRALSLQPGSYVLHAQMSGKAALALMLDPASRSGRVVIPEGLSENQVLAKVAAGTDIPLTALKAAADQPAALGLPSYAGAHVEGLLFPATYDFDPSTTATQALSEMIDRFQEEADTLDLVNRAKALGKTPYEVITIASLAEREAKKDDEYGKVARVIYNRLSVGQRLEIDATVLYGLGRTSGGLTAADLDKETAYNTRRNVKGLPPTPIASPGAKALQAALDPPTGDWLYYVLADADGTQFYTHDYDEFIKVRDQSRAKGLL